MLSWISYHKIANGFSSTFLCELQHSILLQCNRFRLVGITAGSAIAIDYSQLFAALGEDIPTIFEFRCHLFSLAPIRCDESGDGVGPVTWHFGFHHEVTLQHFVGSFVVTRLVELDIDVRCDSNILCLVLVGGPVSTIAEDNVQCTCLYRHYIPVSLFLRINNLTIGTSLPYPCSDGVGPMCWHLSLDSDSVLCG